MAPAGIAGAQQSAPFAAVALCRVVQGCASPEMTVTQSIQFETPGCAAARCEFSNDRGVWQLARTPGSVAVRVSGDPLKVSCFADGEPSAAAKAASTRPGTSRVVGAVGGVVGGTAAGAALGGTALAFIPPLGVIAVLTGAAIGGLAGDAAGGTLVLAYPFSLLQNNWGGTIRIICAADAFGTTITIFGDGRDAVPRVRAIGNEVLNDVVAALRRLPRTL